MSDELPCSPAHHPLTPRRSCHRCRKPLPEGVRLSDCCGGVGGGVEQKGRGVSYTQAGQARPLRPRAPAGAPDTGHRTGQRSVRRRRARLWPPWMHQLHFPLLLRLQRGGQASSHRPQTRARALRCRCLSCSAAQQHRQRCQSAPGCFLQITVRLRNLSASARPPPAGDTCTHNRPLPAASDAPGGALASVSSVSLCKAACTSRPIGSPAKLPPTSAGTPTAARISSPLAYAASTGASSPPYVRPPMVHPSLGGAKRVQSSCHRFGECLGRWLGPLAHV